MHLQLSFATARVAPEKRFHRPPAAGSFNDAMEMNMSRTSYSEKLRDPRWQKKRLEALDAAGWACEMCADSTSTLHVHHKQYFKGREPWDYDAAQLTTLCDTCHEEHHAAPGRLMDVISRLPLDGMKWIDREKAACLIAGVMGLEDFDLANIEQKAWFQVGLTVQMLVDKEFAALMPAAMEDTKTKGGANA